MAEYTSPAFARRQLRLALRRAREAASLTQGQVAEALDWSISKVNRIETGDVRISGTDLAALLRLLGVTDQSLTKRLAEQARASRQHGWWDAPPFRQHLTGPTRQLIEFESAAVTIRCYQPTLIPGILQTEAYARDILSYWAHEMNADERAARVAGRQLRRERLFGREPPVRYLVLLDESVVMRDVGGPSVMVDQLRQTLDHTASGHVNVRIIPYRDGAPFAVMGGFVLLDLIDAENAILYQESYVVDQIVQTQDAVLPYRSLFERMWELSLSEAASMRLMEARAANMLASLDRVSGIDRHIS